MISITLELPDDVARQAAGAGMLSSEFFLTLMRRELARKKLDFFDTLEKLHALNTPHMTDEEIQTEINAVRQEMRNKK
jgi:hypothetical protein